MRAQIVEYRVDGLISECWRLLNPVMSVQESAGAGAPTGQAALASSYRAELCSPLIDDDGVLIDWLIGYALDTLGASRLELCVTALDRCACQVGDAA